MNYRDEVQARYVIGAACTACEGGRMEKHPDATKDLRCSAWPACCGHPETMAAHEIRTARAAYRDARRAREMAQQWEKTCKDRENAAEVRLWESEREERRQWYYGK